MATAAFLSLQQNQYARALLNYDPKLMGETSANRLFSCTIARKGDHITATSCGEATHKHYTEDGYQLLYLCLKHNGSIARTTH